MTAKRFRRLRIRAGRYDDEAALAEWAIWQREKNWPLSPALDAATMRALEAFVALTEA